jgi:ribosomal protein S18 acetylase RimI-like enzyme
MGLHLSIAVFAPYAPEKHADTVFELEGQIFETESYHPERKKYDTYKGWVVEVDSTLVGFCLYEVINPDLPTSYWYFANFGVIPQYQRRGYGSKMMGTLLHRADKEDKVITLRANQGKQYLINLYQKMGFRLVPNSVNSYNSPLMKRIPNN